MKECFSFVFYNSLIFIQLKVRPGAVLKDENYSVLAVLPLTHNNFVLFLKIIYYEKTFNFIHGNHAAVVRIWYAVRRSS